MKILIQHNLKDFKTFFTNNLKLKIFKQHIKLGIKPPGFIFFTLFIAQIVKNRHGTDEKK